MKKHLYFLCPTDYLEPVINKTFDQENYYYNSLGNSITFDSEMVGQINRLVQTNDIKEITFALSDNNHIIRDAISNRDFIDIRGLEEFYSHILNQKLNSEILWQTDQDYFLVFSYHLNKKISELQLALNVLHNTPVKISGKIYSKDKNIFEDIYSDLVCVDKHCLN
ncbi:hypothetical protein [Aquimarina litoralis]|uniref:hypothetical protein n=1 Tax=Aquimarina litoralis TaxID=584605 RepID=UPI001C5892C0|nr:hypothetical protein [Aquimarina litoralis]MBW1298228.1 hypothetical protein [Aquimarina litoralis]